MTSGLWAQRAFSGAARAWVNWRNLPTGFAAATLLLAIASRPGLSAAQEHDAFFVAPNGHDGWSGHLPAPNAEGTDGPFATFAAAQAAMRASSGKRLTYVRQGLYFLAEPVHVGEADAGGQIMAYPGETPSLYGGLPVRDWHASGGSYVATAPLTTGKNIGLPMLIAGDQRLQIARDPPIGPGEDHESAWLFADSSPDGIDPHRSFRLRAADVGAFATAPPGTVVTIFGQRGWQDYVSPVERIDLAQRVVTLAGNTWDALAEGSRFAVLNTAATPGTWRLDPVSNTLQMRTTDGTPPPPGIVAATLPCILAIEHTHDVTLTGLRLIGSATEGAAVCLSQTQRVALDGLAIMNTGDGIRLSHATESRITNSEISQTGGFGITLRDGSDGTVVAENWLHDIGWLHQDASGIWFDASSRNSIVRNRIETVAKFGIGGGSLGEGGAYDNVIEGNEIDRANQRTSDGGGILVIGWAQDATRDVIRGNIVSRTSALGNTGWDGIPHTKFQDPVTRLVSVAIYLDDWASDVEVRGNLVCNNIGGIELHAGWDNRIEGNVLVGNAGIAISIDAENWLGKGAHPHPMENNRIEHNLVVLDRPSTGQSGVSSVRGTDIAAHFDNNLYTGPGLNAYSFHHERDGFGSDYSFGIQVWQRRGQDLASIAETTAATVVVAGDAVQLTGSAVAPGPLPLGNVGRSQDRGGLAARVSQRCGLR